MTDDEIEAVARALDHWVLGGNDLNLRAASDAIAALDRVRDARGDDEAARSGRWVQPEAFCEQPRCQAKNDGHCHVPENCGHFQPKEWWEATRSPRDEGHGRVTDPEITAEERRARESKMLSPQDEYHEAVDAREWTIEGDPPRVSDGPPIQRGWAVRVVPASRVSPSRDGTVAVDPPLSERERDAIEAMRAAVKIVGGEEPVPYDIRGMAAEVVRLRAEVERLSSRDGTVAVEDVASWLQHIDRLDEIAGAKAGLPKYNPLWDAAEAIRIRFASPASTGDREEKKGSNG